jgi:hypothetical protein
VCVRCCCCFCCECGGVDIAGVADRASPPFTPSSLPSRCAVCRRDAPLP